MYSGAPAQQMAPPLQTKQALYVTLGGLACLSLLLVFNSGLLTLLPAGQGTEREPVPTVMSPTTHLPMQGRVLIEDDFTRPGQSHFEERNDETIRYSFEQGAYRIEVMSAGMLAWSLAEGSYGDGVVEADATLVGGPPTTAVGLIFRYQDEQNFYLFNVSSTGFYNLELLRDGTWETLIDWTAAPAIRRSGATNRLRVELDGERINLVVNNIDLETTSDSTFAVGGTALAVNTFEQSKAIALFDNLRIRAQN